MCAHLRVRSIPPLRLERFKNLERLCLRENLIQNIEGLTPLAGSLQELDLYDNLISHIRGLDHLTGLQSLDLSFNKIKHIKNVDHLKRLTSLYFVSNKISHINGLDGLTNLRELELGANRIRVLENLDSLASLQDLWVAKNKITELHGLSGLPNLRVLSIQSNRIRDLSPLSQVPQLEELYISHNALESLKGLENNPKLQVLDVSNNKISNLEGLGPLAGLTEFWASYNQVADFAEVEKELGDKKQLATVYFEGNPLQTRAPALYRNKVRLALPQVRQIDASKFKKKRKQTNRAGPHKIYLSILSSNPLSLLSLLPPPVPLPLVLHHPRLSPLCIIIANGCPTPQHSSKFPETIYRTAGNSYQIPWHYIYQPAVHEGESSIERRPRNTQQKKQER